MRPQSIIRFEQYYLAAAAIAALNQVLNLAGISGPSSADAGLVFVLSIVAVTWGILFLFWYFIARRASNVAKWILVTMTALGLIGTVPIVATLAGTYPFYAVLTSLVTLLQLVAIVFLFRHDAVEWLKSRGQRGPIDVSTFT